MSVEHEGVAVTRRLAFRGVDYAYRETPQREGLTYIVGDEYGRWFPEHRAAALLADRQTIGNEWIEAICDEIPWEVDGDGDPMSIVADAVATLRERAVDPDVHAALLAVAEAARAYLAALQAMDLPGGHRCLDVLMESTYALDRLAETERQP